MISPFTLPNGKRIFQVNPAESALQFRNIFVECCYLHGEIALSPGDIVVDAGANVGLASLFAHWHAPGVSVHAFEPSSRPFQALEQNFRTHGVRGGAVRCALGRKTGVRELEIYPDKTAMSGFYVNLDRDRRITRQFLENSGFDAADVDDLSAGESATERETVRVVRLSDWWDETGLSRIDLLKINVERAEQDVLSGIEERHWPHIRQVAMQIHDDVRSLTDVRQDFQSKGFLVETWQNPLLAGTGIFEVNAWRNGRP